MSTQILRLKSTRVLAHLLHTNNNKYVIGNTFIENSYAKLLGWPESTVL